MRGSKRVVVVKNRDRNVMVMPAEVPRLSTTHQESSISLSSELPVYLTPLPRKASDKNNSKYVSPLNMTMLNPFSLYPP